MKDQGPGRQTAYKIGCSVDPQGRLNEIKRRGHHPGVRILEKYRTRMMRSAEEAAQHAVMATAIGMKQLTNEEGDFTDWFSQPMPGVTEQQIKDTVRRAVSRYN